MKPVPTPPPQQLQPFQDLAASPPEKKVNAAKFVRIRILNIYFLFLPVVREDAPPSARGGAVVGGVVQGMMLMWMAPVGIGLSVVRVYTGMIRSIMLLKGPQLIP